MKRTLILFAATFAVAAIAQAQRVAVTITTVGNLPATCNPGQPYMVTDATSSADCATGAGSTQHWCFCNATGNGYDAQPGGSPDPDSVGTNELNDGSDTPLTGQIVAVDSAASTQFEYLALGGALSNDGDTLNLSGDYTSATHDHSNAAGGGDVALGAGSTGTTATKGDTDTSIATTAFVDAEIRGFWFWDAFDLHVDGTRCKAPVGKQINSGAWVGSIDCDDNGSSAFYGSELMEQYEGGTIVFTLQAINVNATPSGVLDFDFSCQCRGDSDVMNSTWGSPQNSAITFTTQFDLEHGDTAAATCDGTCVAGDTLFWRAVMDSVATTTQVADVEIIGVTAREQ